MMCIWHKSYTFALWIENRHVKVIFAVMKQLKQLQRKPRKKSEASTGFEPMNFIILMQHSTNWAMKPRWKQVKSEFNLYTLYEENEMCIYDINHTQIWLNYYTCSSLNWIYTFSISDSELGNFVQHADLWLEIITIIYIVCAVRVSEGSFQWTWHDKWSPTDTHVSRQPLPEAFYIWTSWKYARKEIPFVILLW